MEVFQRGSSIAITTGTSNNYTADRWACSVNTNQTSTVAQYATSDTTNLPNIRYCARVQRNSGQTGTSNMFFDQSIETANSIPFIGKTVTVSFYARAGATFLSAGNTLTTQLVTGTGTDQNISTSSGTGVAGSTVPSLTANWQRFAFTAPIGTSVTQLFLRFQFTPTGTAGASDYYEITGVQIDLGSYTATTAPAFRRSGGTLQGELAACQRYYQRINNNPSGYGGFGSGFASATTNVRIECFLPVQMRALPSAIDYSTLSSTFSLFDGTGQLTPSAISYNTPESYVNIVHLDFTVSGATQYRPFKGFFQASSAGYVGFSAEL
jgi:hypothetical protein